MRGKKILKIISCIFAVLIICAGCFTLSYTMPRNIVLEDIEDQGAIVAGNYKLLFNTENGSFSVAKKNTTIFQNAVSVYHSGSKTIKSSDYTDFDISEKDLDNGKKITVNMIADGLDTLVQTFYLYNTKEYFTTQISIQSADSEVQTNYIAPLVIENSNLQNSKFKWENALEVPFDNDGWAEFQVKKLWQNSVSYEVGALFTADEGSGFILGSLNHDTWKTGIQFNGGFGKIQNTVLYCGATDPRTGNEPHGTVTGKTVESPLMFIGVYDNWKTGMNEFALANTEIQPKRTSVTNTSPLGWNSWGSVQTDLSYDIATGISDYVKNNLQSVWQTNDESVYINLDSWWDLLSDEELKDFVDYCHKNNQKAGIYWAPFVCWYDEDGIKNTYIADTEYTYNDVRLKKNDGTYYGNEVDGCYPLDVTNPAVKLQAEKMIGRFRAAGFDYIKLDFLVHGSFEGDFYNKDIQTGIQAYNYGMNYVTEFIGKEMFINLAMSPTFPYQYANGRRLACDSYSHIAETEYTLNSVTYGFWEQQIYDYTDPDHIVVWGKDADTTEEEARSRVTSGIISGTSFLAGDNFVHPNGNADEANTRFIELLGNKEIMRVAKIGQIFTPVITNVSNRTANIFKLEANGKLYIAVINYDKKQNTYNIDLGNGSYTAQELWHGTEEKVSSTLMVTLDGTDSAIYELTPTE